MAAHSKNVSRKRQARYKRPLLVVAGSVVIGIVIGALYLFAYDPKYDGTVEATNQTKVFAHRGYGNHGPDNSLAASERALEELPVSGVDVDAQLTKDGKLVIFHDLSLGRLTEKSGKVADYTLAELKALDLNIKYTGAGYDQAYVESFEEFVKRITPRATLMVEMKVTGTGDTGAEREAYRIIKQNDAFDSVILSSFNPLVLNRLEKLDRRVQTMFIFMDTNWNKELLAEMNPKDVVDLPWFLRNEATRRAVRKIVRPDYLSVNVDVAPQTRKHLIDQGWPVFLWSPNSPEKIAEAIKQRPYGIISDEPRQVLTQLGDTE